jgi:hypothetical protein
VLLAQCLSAADCELPHTVPWWMVAAFAAGWVALVVAIVTVVRHLLQARAGRRRRRRPEPPATDVELHRGDLERW